MIRRDSAARLFTLVRGVLWSTGAAVAAFIVLAGCEGAGTDGPRGAGSDTVPAAFPGDSAGEALPVDAAIPVSPDDESAAPAQSPALAADLRAALQERMRGPSSDADAGEASMFTAETADALRSVSVDSAGYVTVDFHDLRPMIPNVSSSAGSAVLLNELNATVFGFPQIESVEYRMDGSCDLFWEWLQYECQTVTRESAA